MNMMIELSDLVQVVGAVIIQIVKVLIKELHSKPIIVEVIISVKVGKINQN